jgi:uncharacterized protein YkwD
VAWASLLIGGSVAAQSAGTSTGVRCGTVVAPEEVLRRLNEVRLHGMVCHASGTASVAAPLRWSDSLAAIAATQSAEMAALNRMIHRDSQDRALDARLGAGGYPFRAARENIAVGYPSLDEVMQAWLASEAHCANMLDNAVLEAGLACSDSDSVRGDRYWTLVLGSPSGRR